MGVGLGWGLIFHPLIVGSERRCIPRYSLSDFIVGAKVLVKGQPNVSYICSRYYRAYVIPQSNLAAASAPEKGSRPVLVAQA